MNPHLIFFFFFFFFFGHFAWQQTILIHFKPRIGSTLTTKRWLPNHDNHGQSSHQSVKSCCKKKHLIRGLNLRGNLKKKKKKTSTFGSTRLTGREQRHEINTSKQNEEQAT